jgi:diguanylate cyclase (GGDEF)-like protein
VVVDGDLLGWVEGGRTARGVASVLAYAAARERDKRSLANEALERYRELSLIYDLAATIGGSDAVEPVVHTAVTELSRLPHDARGFLLLADGDDLRPAPGSDGEGSPIRGARVGTGIVGTIAANGGAELLEDAGADPRATLIRVHHALYRACRALGRVDEALAHLEQHDRLERRRSTNQLKAQSRLFVTRVEAEHVRRQAERAHHEAQRERTRAAGFQADALRDQLTGLGNRRHLDERLPALLATAEAGAQPLSMALVDLDHFKRINDRFGHATGDRVLVQLAQQLRENTRGGDVVARLGGEEFLIVLADMPTARAREVCERLRARVAAHPWEEIAPGLSVTLSIGLAHAPPYRLEPLFEAADRAMYQAKQAGRNRVAG